MHDQPTQSRQLVGLLRGFAHRHWQSLLRLRGRLRLSEQTVDLLLAGGVGVLGGIVNLSLHGTTELFKALFLHQRGDLVEIAASLGPWQRLVIPAAGGLAAGAILYLGLRLLRHQGSGNLLEVVVAGDGRLPFRSGLLKTLSSLVSISTGSSIGREGIITQFSATLASKLGQAIRWPPYRLRLLVACGTAAGMASAYNAPIAGAVFAAHIVLGNFSMNLFAPLVFSSVLAAVFSRSFFGIAPWYDVPENVEFTRVGQLPWFILLGVLSGLLGAVFLKMLRTTEVWFNRIPAALPARMAIGGLGVGAIALQFPQVWGNGYGVTNDILHGGVLLGPLAGLFLAKLIATLLSVGSGALGGIFTPTLFLGAALGSLFGAVLHAFDWALPLPSAAFALVGMAATLAATTHSPLLAMIAVFEISLEYTLMPPLMVGCAVATLVSRRFHPASVYTEPLRQRGLELRRESARIGSALQQAVGDLLRHPVPPLAQTTALPEIADRFLTSPHNFLPVVDADQRLVGIVALQDLKEYLGAGEELSGVIAFDVMRPPPPTLTPDQSLLDALPVIIASELKNIPVINNRVENRLVGAVVRAEALDRLSDYLAPDKEPGG